VSADCLPTCLDTLKKPYNIHTGHQGDYQSGKSEGNWSFREKSGNLLGQGKVRDFFIWQSFSLLKIGK